MGLDAAGPVSVRIVPPPHRHRRRRYGGCGPGRYVSSACLLLFAPPTGILPGCFRKRSPAFPAQRGQRLFMAPSFQSSWAAPGARQDGSPDPRARPKAGPPPGSRGSASQSASEQCAGRSAGAELHGLTARCGYSPSRTGSSPDRNPASPSPCSIVPPKLTAAPWNCYRPPSERPPWSAPRLALIRQPSTTVTLLSATG